MGRIVVGRVLSGTVKVGDSVHCLDRDGTVIESASVYKVVARRGLDRVVIDEGVAGDIIGVSGFTKANATMTCCSTEIKVQFPASDERVVIIIAGTHSRTPYRPSSAFDGFHGEQESLCRKRGYPGCWKKDSSKIGKGT